MLRPWHVARPPQWPRSKAPANDNAREDDLKKAILVGAVLMHEPMRQPRVSCEVSSKTIHTVVHVCWTRWKAICEHCLHVAGAAVKEPRLHIFASPWLHLQLHKDLLLVLTIGVEEGSVLPALYALHLRADGHALEEIAGNGHAFLRPGLHRQELRGVSLRSPVDRHCSGVHPVAQLDNIQQRIRAENPIMRAQWWAATSSWLHR
mmetsp:Transcript_13563/g.23871  ORF Transcript_13563/g.23871 Transcript_13563/m.23871 type:complete len:205 (+) Transcript_13563:148-762(+)